VKKVLLVAALLLPMSGLAAAKPGWFGLGVTLHDSATPEHTKWLYVRMLDSDGPAAAAGLHVSDVITAINGKPVAFATNADLLRYFEAAKPGMKLTFSVVRQQRKLAVTVRAVPLPDKYAQRRAGNRRYVEQHDQ
jgi:S1-C subfamily serine protease